MMVEGIGPSCVLKVHLKNKGYARFDTNRYHICRERDFQCKDPHRIYKSLEPEIRVGGIWS